MPPETVIPFTWPEFGSTAPIVAVALALAVFVLGAFSGARANRFRIVFAVSLATAIGWFAMPLAVKLAAALGATESETGVMVVVTLAMVFVAAVATSVYEIITVTFPDVGLGSKK